MNKARRQTLNKIIGALTEQAELLSAAAEEEEDYMDNMPENLQGSQRYEDAEENVADLESASDYLNDAIESIQSAIDR